MGAGVGALLVLAASPSSAAVQSGNGINIAPSDVVSRATATAVNIGAGTNVASGVGGVGGGVGGALQGADGALGGGVGGSVAGIAGGGGGYVAVNDGTIEQTIGSVSPQLPAIGAQQVVVGGAIGQDAVATSTGLSAACAGIVGSNGQIQLGPDNTCLTNGGGEVRLSLGSMQQLGLAQVLGQLPELPALSGLPQLPGLNLSGSSNLSASALPDVQLQYVGSAITANCLQGPDGLVGKSSPIQGQIVAVVNGQQVPIASVPTSDSVSVNPTDVLSQIQSQLPAQASGVVDQVLTAVPADQLQSQRLLQLQVNDRSVQNSQISVTALGVHSNLSGGAANLQFGSVTCGPNVGLDNNAPQTGSNSDADAGVAGGVDAGVNAGDKASGSVSADSGSQSGSGEVAANANLAPATDSNPMTPIGLGTAAAILLTGLGIAALRLLRSRRPVSGSHQ